MAAGWVFLPAIGAPLAHAPVLRWDLAPALRRPISRRLFGQNKTWRGARALLGLAWWIGELPNSFLKRRLGIPPGEHRRSPAGALISLLDQADWVPTAWILLRPVWRMSAQEAGQVFVLVAAVHVPINLIGYAIGARTTPR